MLPILRAGGEHYPLELGHGAEPEQQTDAKAGNAQVVDQLGLRAGRQKCACLEFDHHEVLDDEIGAVRTDALAAELDIERVFALNEEAAFAKYYCQRRRVHALEQPIAKLVVHGQNYACSTSTWLS